MAFGFALLVVLVGLYLSGFHAVRAILGLGLAALIAAGVRAMWGERTLLFRLPLADS